jgi:ankyrin repeat protein
MLLLLYSPPLGAFNAAILQVVCVSQVVDIEDPAYMRLKYTMPPSLRGRIYLVKSRFPEAKNSKHLAVIAEVNRALDVLTRPSDERQIEQHRCIAEAVACAYPAPFWLSTFANEPIDAKMEAQNVLCGAIVLGDLPLVESLQASKSPMAADLNRPNPYFGRPLSLAAAWGHHSIVDYLLHHGADPRLTLNVEEEKDLEWQPNVDLSLDGRFFEKRPIGSALRAATLGGHEDVARLLLEPKYCLSPTKVEYFRAIVAGARGGHLHLIELLLQTMGKNVTDFPGLGDEMLWEAVRHDQLDVVQMLLQSGINVNSYPWPNLPAERGTLSVAAAQGNTRMVRFLLEQGADVNCTINRDDEVAIECAARCGQEEVVEYLLEQGADPFRALRSASEAGQARVVRLLLARDANLLKQYGSQAGRVALRKAIIAKNPTVISLLVDAGVPLNDGYNGPYELPICTAKAGAAQWLVDFLISLGATDEDLEDYPTDSPRFLEEDVLRQHLVGGVRVTRRTWEWVGKY